MCGIAGIVGLQTKQFESSVRKMTTCIAHRGPDAEDCVTFENCILGHRRLSIIDLSTGDQPMHSPYGATIIFNGEFYGYKQVKKLLNYPYKTKSDTEVILALYHQYGPNDFIKHIRGMFSFAIWDEKNQLLIAARDRFGEKPFFYAYTKEGHLIFASEIKSILASGLIEPEIKPESLVHYLQHLYVHPHHTIYKNIFNLPPAHYLIFQNGNTTINRYWDLPCQQLKISFDDAKSECRRLLKKSVEEQMIADVPVGSFLSGGLDSSTITALASQSTNHQLTTISFSFGKNNSELPFSRQISKKYNTHNIELHQDDYEIAGWFEKMVGIYDEPFADSSCIPTYLVSKMASEKLKVVLTGDGGDELMAGYTFWYRPLYLLQNEMSIHGRLKNTVKKIRHPHYRKNRISEIHLEQNCFFNKQTLKHLLIKKNTYSFDKFLDQPYNTVDAAMRMDLLDYMPGDILVKTDRAAMANSLELRAPFLDVDFAEFCISLPEDFKISLDTDKILLRESFGDLWTPDIKKRSKQGFGAPVHEWLQQKKMQQLKNDYLFDQHNKIYDWLNFKECVKYFDQNNYSTWILLTLAVWMNRHYT